MHTIDIIIVIAYLIICILLGLYRSKSIKTLKEYTLGTGHFPDIVIIATIFATDIGASSTMGTVEKVCTLGVLFIVTRFVKPLLWLVVAKIYGENIGQFRDCISISDIMEKLYGNAGRWITNISALLIATTVITLQGTAIGYIFYYFIGINRFYGTIVGISVMALYSAFGGIRAVALTDVFQFIIFIIAIPIACSFAYRDAGGYVGIIDSLPREILAPDVNVSNIVLFFSLIFSSFPDTGGTFIQRFLMATNSKQLTQSLRIVGALNLFYILIVCTIGLAIKAQIPDIKVDNAFFYFIQHYLPIGIKGFLIVGLLAIIMSTADSWLNTTSILLVHDIVGKLVPLTQQRALFYVRFSTLIISILAIVLTFAEKGIMELEWLSGNFWEPLILVPLIAGFLRFRTNNKSFIVSITTAILSTAISGYIVGDLATISLMCGIIGSALGLFGMHYWQIHQGVLNVHTQQAKLTNTNINENANMDRKIAVAESKCNINAINMYKDGAENTKTIADKLIEQSFIQGVAEGHMHAAKTLLSQGFDMEIIERATGISRTDLIKLQQDSKKTH